MKERETGMENKKNFWTTGFAGSSIKSDKVTLPEMLFGYFIGPIGAMLSSGIFTSILQNYFTDVLKLDLTFLTTLQLLSTILIIAANLIVGQLIERTRCLAGKARPWILLSALTLSVASVLMFIVPFEGTSKMVWIAIAYNLYYAVAYPIYNTANATLVPVSTRDSEKRGVLASVANVAGLAVMGAGSMVFPILVSFALKDNQNLWFLTMLAIAIFAALSIYLQYRFTRERVTEELMGEKAANGDTDKAADGSRPGNVRRLLLTLTAGPWKIRSISRKTHILTITAQKWPLRRFIQLSQRAPTLSRLRSGMRSRGWIRWIMTARTGRIMKMCAKQRMKRQHRM